MKYKRFSVFTAALLAVSFGLAQQSSFAATKSPFTIRQYQEIAVTDNPSWSSDGKYLYFGIRLNGEYQVVRQTLDTRRAQIVANGRMPSVSPDGTNIATSNYGDGMDGHGQFSKIYDLDSGEQVADVQQLTGLPQTFGVVWNHDGSRLYFYGSTNSDFDNGADNWHLYEYDFLTSATRLVLPDFGASNYIVLNSSSTHAALYINELESGVTVNLQTGSYEIVPGCKGAPAFINGTTNMVCTQYVGSGKIFVVSAAGSDAGLIASGNWPSAGRVSPDGKYVPFIKSINGIQYLFVAALSGGFPKWAWNAFDGVSINSAALATNSIQVTLNFRPPLDATEILVSNDGGFADAQDFPVDTESTVWSLVENGPPTSTRIVYVRYGTGGTYTDSVILDTTAPKVSSVALLSASIVGANREFVARAILTERGSGITRVQYGTAGTSVGLQSKKLSYEASQNKQTHNVKVTVPKAKKKVWMRFRDAAGNWSKWVTVIRK